MRTQTELHHRIAYQHGSSAAAMGAYHPYGTADTPMTMPLVRIEIRPGGAIVEDMAPLYTAGRTGPVPATAPHTWFQLYAAGRP
jgi:hypothetical protein